MCGSKLMGSEPQGLALLKGYFHYKRGPIDIFFGIVLSIVRGALNCTLVYLREWFELKSKPPSPTITASFNRSLCGIRVRILLFSC